MQGGASPVQAAVSWLGAAVQAAADDLSDLVSQERVLESTLHLACLTEGRDTGAAAAIASF